MSTNDAIGAIGIVWLVFLAGLILYAMSNDR